MVSQEKIDTIKNKNERIFAKNFFDHDEWVSQPAPLDLGGYTYKPDFYDKKRNVYIEVSASRQAYHQNKAKYFKVLEILGKDKFEIREPSGEKISITGNTPYLHPLWDVIGMYEQYEQAALKIFCLAKEKRGMTFEEISERAFPSHHDALNKTKLIFEGKLHLSLTDFLCLCHAFSYELIDLILALNQWKGCEYVYPEQIYAPTWDLKVHFDEFPELLGMINKVCGYETTEEHEERIKKLRQAHEESRIK